MQHHVCVTLDDSSLAGGIEALDMHAPQELRTVEVFRQLRQVRVYTRLFVEDLQEGPLRPLPVSYPSSFGRLGY